MDRERTTSAVKALLKIVGGGIVLSAGFVAPNVISMLEPIINNSERSDLELKRLLRHMRRVGLIQKQSLIDGGTYITLTSKGKIKLKQVEIEEINITDEKTWNGTWHVVTFDIPAINRKQRNEVSHHLKRLGMYNFQRSLWAYPFSCENEVQAIANILGANKYFIYMQAKIDDIQHKKLLSVFSHKLASTKLTK